MDTHHGGGLLDRLRHHLPTQASLKDFIHHNTLHAYQDLPFHQALRTASSLHGSATYLSLSEYRHLQQTGRISQEILQNRVQRYLMERYHGPYPQHEFDKLLDRILYEQPEDADIHARIGRFRAEWIHQREINLNKSVHPLLFRLIAGYLDQGIASWKFPYPELGFIQGLRRIVNEGSITIFRSAQVRRWFRHGIPSLSYLLERVVGDATAFETYLFDQQFEHPGWSGFVATTEAQPEILLDRRHVTLEEWIVLELLLEIDALDHKFPGGWLPLTASAIPEFPDLFADLPDQGEQSAILEIWQDAYEWSYYDQVLGGLKQTQSSDQMGQMRQATDERDTFQAIFCIDDREYSLRRHLQNRLKSCSTYGTPGFFGVAIYFQPEHGKFITKCCPAPVEPRHLVVEHERKRKPTRDISMRHARGSLVRGWLLSNTLGLMAGMRLLGNLFNPRPVAVMADSLQHMDEHAKLEYVYNGRAHQGYQIGFTDQEMTSIVHRTLSTIGLTSHFAAHIYMIGHGGSSVNNPYYAGYDCGACSGRPGSVNARLFAAMANRHEVRHMLREQYGWHIPAQTRFIGALHDTTRDEVVYFDVHSADLKERALHHRFVMGMKQALVDNARERAIRFPSVHRSDSDARLMRAIRKRSFAFFEPRPEWNHTDNALVIVGRAQVFRGLYLDKRPFLNSYDYRQDPTGEALQAILSAAIPVCGGINLEYYFSRVDAQYWGAGTKLPHNVVGLFAVNNGIDGDLRPGLPSQMTEIHEPIRVMFIVEQQQEVVELVFERCPGLYDWVQKGWVWFSILDPTTNLILVYQKGQFTPYEPFTRSVEPVKGDESYVRVANKTDQLVARL
ncbi:MAG: YbcC family protein [Bacteroidia bacterium]